MFKKFKSPFVFFLKISVLTFAIAFSIINFSDFHHSYIRNKVGSKVVKIVNPNKGGGTGFHVKAKSGQTYILTNAHICEMSENGEPLQVTLEGSKQPMDRKIIFVSKKHDMCLMEAIPGVEGLSLANNVDIGDKITVVGHPNLRPLILSEGELIDKDSETQIVKYIIETEEQQNKCEGKIATFMGFFGPVTVCLQADQAYQVAAITYPGNSGSPVVNKFGNVIGLLYAGRGNIVNDAYLVKLEYLKELLELY